MSPVILEQYRGSPRLLSKQRTKLNSGATFAWWTYITTSTMIAKTAVAKAMAWPGFGEYWYEFWNLYKYTAIKDRSVNLITWPMIYSVEILDFLVVLIMVIELSGVQFGLKSYAWFQNWTSAQREFDLKSQVWFQTKIAQHEVQLPLYYIHFEIAQIQDLVSSNILLLQYWASLKLNSFIFWEEKIRVLETKVSNFATWYFMSFIFLQCDRLL